MLEIQKNVEGTRVNVALIGRLDTTTSPALDSDVKSMFDAGAKEIILDLTDLVYVSSAGLRVILSIQKKVNAIQGSLLVRNPNEIVAEVFNATGFDEVIAIEKG